MAVSDADASDVGVSRSSGAATLRIPIAVPPGPGGLQPNLALVYSSAAGDGPYGVGWRLPLGAVACTARFGVPDYASCPRYELDGELLTAGEEAGRYHTFVESFQKVERVAGSGVDEWRVTSPDGITRIFGGTPDSRIEAAPGVTARWLLSAVSDPFGNTVSISYTADPDGDGDADVGMAYPQTMVYASGQRSVTFVYEPRPDPLHDFVGGIERELTHRLREIQVTSQGLVFQRRVLGYADTGYSTARSRLAWTQVYGSDCTDLTSPPDAQCSALPARELDYTDPNDTLGPENTAQWDRWEAEPNPYTVPLGSVPLPSGTIRTSMGDIDGNGLPDFIFQAEISGEPTLSVYTNTSSGGFALDPDWTARLRELEYDHPRMELTQVRTVDALGLNPHLGVCAATLTETRRALASGAFTALRPGFEVSTGAIDESASGGTVSSHIEAQGRYFLADVDTDGLADIVVSVRLSGVTKNVDCNGNLLDPSAHEYVEGKTVSLVFRNTGKAVAEVAGEEAGWVANSDLARGLPPLDEVSFEGASWTEQQSSMWDIMDTAPLVFDHLQYDGPCAGRGLRGYIEHKDTSGDPVLDDSGNRIYPHEDVCFNLIDLAPQFVDLNGDGHVDLLALQRKDPTRHSPWVGYWGLWAVAESNELVTRAWLQNPHAPSGQARWVRAPEFDLPQLETAWAHTYVETRQWPTLEPWRPLDEYDYPSIYPATYSVDRGVRIADLNRDGLVDVVWKVQEGDSIILRSGVLLNSGRGDPATTGSAWCASNTDDAAVLQGGHCPDAAAYLPPDRGLVREHWDMYAEDAAIIPEGFLGDLNGDGWVDYLFLSLPDDPGRGVAAYLWNPDPSGGGSWTLDSRFDPFLESELDTVAGDPAFGWTPAYALLDVNGDGVDDVVGEHSRVSRSHHADHLRAVRNGRGGEVTLTYDSAIRLRDAGLENAAEADAIARGEGDGVGADLPHWSTRGVVTSRTVSGLATEPATTSYAYARPRWCREHRASLGFGLVTRVRPDDSRVDSFHYQHHGRAGQTHRVETRDAANQLVFSHEETWELLTTAIPGSLVPGPEHHLGRIATSATRNEYAAGPGALVTRSFQYDDAHGYNFVGTVEETRPSGVLRTVRTPAAANEATWQVRLVDDRRQEDGGGRTLAHASFSYTLEGRVERRTYHVHPRSDPTAARGVVTAFTYDAWGNLTQRTDDATGESRVTQLCYDGDPSPCPQLGQSSHSLPVGAIDPLGMLVTSEPDPATGAVRVVSSDYVDEPRTRHTLDAFGRPTATWVTPEGGGEVKVTDTVYQDFHDPAAGLVPYVEEKAYPDASGTHFVHTVTVGDGWGGVWKTVQANADGGFFGTVRYADPADPAGALVRETAPLPCADLTCSTRAGATETPATVTTLDALGRPLRVETPDGTSLAAYGSAVLEGERVDQVLAMDAEGHLTERLRDGDRILAVTECDTSLEPVPSALVGNECPSGDVTTFAYEPTGELAAAFDPLASSSLCAADPAHCLGYHYDTMGRVVRIDDPDKSSASGPGGSTTTTYDAFGDVATSTNARGQVVSYDRDPLGRLTAVRHAGAVLHTVTYAPDHRQRTETTTGTGYTAEFFYDGHGRLQRRADDHGTWVLTDFAYDLLGRRTRIDYPTWDSSASYVYEGAYLRKVCDGADPADCESGSEGHTWWVSDIQYDALGRPDVVTTPGGTLDREYGATSPTGDPTQRLSDLELLTGATNAIDLAYTYDARGNVASIVDTHDPDPDDPVDGSAAYAYDARNRLSAWCRGDTGTCGGGAGPWTHFAYDPLGNLVGREVPDPDTSNQVFDPERPHAVTRNRDGVTYAYDADGNVVRRGSRHFTWDPLGRLACVGTTAGGCDVARYTYDVDGVRVREEGVVDLYRVGDLFEVDGSRVHTMHVPGLGRRIATKVGEDADLRLSGAPPGWRPHWPWPDGVDPVLLAGGAAGLALLALLARLGAAQSLRARPGKVTVSLTAATSLLWPSVALAGGQGTNENAVWTLRWIHADHLGSGILVTDASGNVVMRRAFDPFGSVVDQTAPTEPSETLFAGQPEQAELGLYDFDARWYDPTSGTFLAIDPVITDSADPQFLNPYSYVRNNPANGLDPTGMSCGYGPLGIASWGCPPANVMFLWGGGAYESSSRNSYDLNQHGEPRIPGEFGRVYSLNKAAGFQSDLIASGPFKLPPLEIRFALDAGASQGASTPGVSPGADQGGGFWRGVADVIGKIWTLPYTALGLAIGLPALALSAVATFGWNALHIASLGRFGRFGWVGTGLSFGNNAIQFTNFPIGSDGALTLGNVQIYRNISPGTNDLFYGTFQNAGLHEQAHTLQYQVLGPFFAPAYLLSGSPFTGANPFEAAATDYSTGNGGWLP